jgi:hypothetical protein
MSDIDIQQLFNDLRAQMERDGQEMQGLGFDDLRDAMSHPAARAEVARIMAREQGSISAGDPAPDFDLPRLPGPHGEGRVRLSDHFGKRPVALIFGSYT